MKDNDLWIEGKKKTAVRETTISNNYYKGGEYNVCVRLTKHKGTQR